MTKISLSRSKPLGSKTKRTLPTKRYCFLISILLSSLTLCMNCLLGHGQQMIPEIIELRSGFVGVRYELPLASLLPDGAPRVTWSVVCHGKGAGNADLECPEGLRLANIEETKMEDGRDVTRVVGQKLIVQPVATDLLKDRRDVNSGRRSAPYVFEADGSPVEVKIRFKLQVKPLGVDESRFKPASADDRRPDRQDELRDIAVKFTPARAVPPPPAPQPPAPPFVLVKSTSDEETLALTEEFDDSFDPRTVILDDTSNRANFVISGSDAGPLVRGTIGTDAAANFENGDYLVVHVIKWKQLKENKSDPERELWALFEKIQKRKIDGQEYEWLPHFATSEKGKIQDKRLYDTRIFGSKRVFILPIHLNTPHDWDIKYKLTINQQIPTPIQNAIELATTVLGGSGVGEAVEQREVKDLWGARLVLFRYVASDMIVQVNAVTPTTDIQVKEQNKDYSKKYDNEGRYRWDVSVGLPVNSIKELEYSIDTTGQNSVVSVKKKERQNAYGFLNIYPRPVDLEANSFLTKPHLVFGVPISGKPLDRPIIGLGSGIYRDLFKINFFAGVAFNKVREPATLQTGTQATEGQLETDLRTRRQRKFVFGINFPVKQFISALKANK